MPEPRDDVRPPQQRRSQQSLERILTAGADVLRESGLAGFTVQAVSARAGVGVGSIYLRVSGRDALILAVFDRETARMRVEYDAAIAAVVEAELPPVAHVTALIGAIGGHMLRHADLLAVFMGLGPADERIWRAGRERSRELGAAFRAAMVPVRDAIVHPEPDAAIDVLYRIVYDTMARTITRGIDFIAEQRLDGDALLRELSGIAVQYLFVAPLPRG